MQKILVALSFFGLLFFTATPVFAELRINEFSSNGSSDWLEIYNDSTDSVDLSSYRIRDNSATNKLDLTGTLGPHGFVVFDWGDKLNNGGDVIKIVLQVDESSVIDQVAYGSSGDDVAAPSTEQTAGRQSDGSLWVIFSASSRGSSNASSLQVPSPTSIPQPTSTPTKVPTPTKTPTPTKSPTATKVPTTAKNDSTKASKSSPTTSVLANNTQRNSAKSASSSSSVNKSQPINVKDEESKKEVKNDTVLVQGDEKNKVLLITTAGSLCLIACAILLYLKGKKVQNAN